MGIVATKTSAKILATAERRAYVLKLRRAGWTYEKIALAAVNKFGADQLPAGWDTRYAYKDVKRELDKLHEDNAETAEDIRQIVTIRMDRMVEALWPKALRGNVAAIDRVTKIDERRCKLWGVDAPQKLEHTGKDGGPLEMHTVNTIIVREYVEDDDESD